MIYPSSAERAGEFAIALPSGTEKQVLNPGETIYLRDPDSPLPILVFGSVIAYHINRNRKGCLGFFRPESLVGETFFGRRRSQKSLTAVGTSELYLVPRGHIGELLEDADWVRRLEFARDRDITTLEQRVRMLDQTNLPERLAETLLDLTDGQIDHKVKVPQKLIADLASGSRPVVNQLMRRWSRMGILHQEGRSFSMKESRDIENLERIARGSGPIVKPTP